MTATVQYWRLPEEEADLVTYLRWVEPTVALPARRHPTPETIVWKPVDEAFLEPDHTFLITPERFARGLKIHRGEDGYAASVVATPALFYYRGYLITPKRLLHTAFSIDTPGKPPELVRWAKNVMKWVRPVAPGWHRYRSQWITPKADEARLAGMEMVW